MVYVRQQWWLKAFVEQALDREMRRKQLQMNAAVRQIAHLRS